MKSNALEEKFYTVRFRAVPYEVHAYGVNPKDAIAAAAEEIGRPELVNGMVRPAVYGELDYGPEHFTNGGDFIRDTSKPCRNCGTAVKFYTYKEELGYCVDCSNLFWNGELDA